MALSLQRVGAVPEAPSADGVGLVVAWRNYACAFV